jgi:hypothetical protein
MIHIERDARELGHERLIRITNGQVELLVATTFGIRVLSYRLADRGNVFGLVERENPTSFGGAWHLRGGHRLWAAPEHPVDTYWPDDTDIAIGIEGTELTLTQPIEPPTGVEKSIALTLEEGSSRVVVRHRLINRGAAVVRIAPWALTVMRRGGQAIVPNGPFVPHPIGLLPRRSLVIWP